MIFNYRQRQFDIVGARPDDHIARLIADRATFYEIDLLEYLADLREFLWRPGAVAVDVGANIGNHAVFIGTFVVENVLAIEPNPAVLAALRKNLHRNGIRADVASVALGARHGRGKLVWPASSRDNLGMAQVVGVEGADPTTGPVVISTLDAVVGEWMAKRGTDLPVALVKIDVEGAELAVLGGATRVIEQYHPHLFVECQSPAAHQAVREFLEPRGYAVLSRWAATPVYHFAWAPSSDLVARARGLVGRSRLKTVAGRVWSLVRRLFSR